MSFNTSKPRILLIQPPVYDFALFDLFLKPYGRLRIGRWLENSGYDVVFVNALDYKDSETSRILGIPGRRPNGTGKFHRMRAPLPEGIRSDRYFGRYGILPEVLRKKIKAARPDLVFITSGMTYWYKGVVEAAAVVKELYPEIPVVTGGIYASLMPEHCMKYTLTDYVVSGSTVSSLVSILNHLSLPVPRDQLPGSPMMQKGVWEDAGVIRLNEGCPFHCDYCASDILSSRFNQGRWESAFDNLLEIHERFGTENFAFYDDALLVNSSTGLNPFLEKIVSKGLSLKFYLPNAIHIRFLDKETALLMKRAGFREIRLGYESSSSNFHSEYDDKFSEDDLFRAVEVLKGSGFSSGQITAYVLGGLPGQSFRSVEKSIRTAGGAGIRVSLAEYSPVPGTNLWEKSKEICPFPLEKEPLFHNNSFFPMKWEGYTVENMTYLKNLSVELNKQIR